MLNAVPVSRFSNLVSADPDFQVRPNLRVIQEHCLSDQMNKIQTVSASTSCQDDWLLNGCPDLGKVL